MGQEVPLVVTINTEPRHSWLGSVHVQKSKRGERPHLPIISILVCLKANIIYMGIFRWLVVTKSLVYIQQQLVTTGNKEQLAAYFRQQVAWNFKKIRGTQYCMLSRICGKIWWALNLAISAKTPCFLIWWILNLAIQYMCVYLWVIGFNIGGF